MDRQVVVFIAAFFYSILLCGLVHAQPVEEQEAVAEAIQENENASNIVAAVQDTAEVKAVVSNIQDDVKRIDRTAQTQDFILKLLAILSPSMLALITWLQIRSQRAAERRDTRRHEDIRNLEKSIDGVQTKVVAVATAAGFEEGAAMDLKHPSGKAAYAERSAELKQEVRDAKIESKDISTQAKTEMKNGD